ncbi:MAG: AmmeMemoRadiSam system protein B, partial [Nitrospirae bacterium]|nr:AmmeMemoRadiSam system protein B [Nitrospirota bacterium]
ATIMLYSANKLGAKEAVLVKYMTSGEVNNDYDHVVGYAGILVK